MCDIMRFPSIILFLFSLQLSAQDIDNKLKQDMIFYGDVMISAQLSDNRRRAADTFDQLIGEYIDIAPANSQVDLSFVKQITSITPDDSLFTISTWPVEFGAGIYEYHGYIFYSDRPYEKLQHNEEMSPSSQYQEHTADDWYGALYYNVVKYSDSEYLLFGRNDNGEFNNSKIADVLHFRDGNMLLGKEIFQDKEDSTSYVNKIYINYSADASVNLNYNPGLSMVVQDHLIQRIGRLPGQGPTHLPDGTYEGYQLEGDQWLYKRKLFDHSYGEDNAPRPNPVLDNKRPLRPKRKSKKRR